MMLHQNFKQINMKDFFVAAEFPKTPSPKPARIPPQTPPAGGKSAEAGRIRNPRQIVSPCRVLFSSFNHLDFARKTFELCPTNTARTKMSTIFGAIFCWAEERKRWVALSCEIRSPIE